MGDTYMNMSIYEFMNLCQGAKSYVNIGVCNWSYVGERMVATELFDGAYNEMPMSLRYEVIKKWDIEMRDYKPYIVLYI